MPKRRSKLPPVRHEIQCQVEGKVYQGTYHISGGVMYVESAYGSKNAHAAGATEAIAKIVLSEIVRDSISKGFA